MQFGSAVQLSRRAFLRGSSLVMTAACLAAPAGLAGPRRRSVRAGLLTDLHYADKAPAGSRHYRETLSKLEEAATEFERAKPDFVVELGDLIDAADSVSVEQQYLKTINRTFSTLCNDRHYVLGNHCVDTLHKEEFLAGVEQQKSWYSFDREGIHFIVLDACFRSDGVPYGRRNFKWTDANIPPAELEWLQQDLQSTQAPTIVFAHQRLDVDNNHGVRNNADVRQVLESSGQVAAVFQGHSHQNDHHEINGIHYCTLVAMVEGSGSASNGYSWMDIESDGTITLTGFRRQNSHSWKRSP